MKQTYSEEDLKKMLTGLLAEKKEELPLRTKNVSNKSDAGYSFEELLTLKSAYQAQETEISQLQTQLDKVKPALKKLIDELQSTKADLDKFKAKDELHKKDKELISQLEKEKEALVLAFQEKNDSTVSSEELLQLERKFVEEKKALLESNRTLNEMAQEKENLLAKELIRQQNFEEERTHLVERLAESVSQNQRLSEMLKDFREEGSSLRKELEKVEEQRKQAENEIDNLKAKQKEHDLLKQKIQKLETEEADIKNISFMLSKELEKKQEESNTLKHQLEVAQNALKESDGTKIKLEYEELLKAALIEKTRDITEVKIGYESEKEVLRQEREKVVNCLKDEIYIQKKEKEQLREELLGSKQEFSKEIIEKEKKHEELQSASYNKLKELFDKNNLLIEECHALEEKWKSEQEAAHKAKQDCAYLESSLQHSKIKGQSQDVEIRKAQGHLAKKVKESTLLRDLLEKQKAQLIELQNSLNISKHDVEKMKSTLQLQKIHEEKIEQIGKERSLSSENLAKEWQEKYFSIHEQLQHAKSEIGELQKIKRSHEQLLQTFSTLKSFIVKTLGLNIQEVQNDAFLDI